MDKKDLVKDTHFEEVNEARVDSKNRISLKRGDSMHIFSYKVYRNSLGQLILDPQVAIPAHEAWLFKNQTAKKMMQKGLADAKNKRLVKADEDYSKYISE